jgi:uncharacterized short protein YbdD (DUF466 family)
MSGEKFKEIPSLSSPRKRGSRLWKFSGFLDSRFRGNDGIRSYLKVFWRAVRRLSGDDAYERYLEHHSAHHADQPPLTRAEFFRRWQEEKWSGTRRCC